MPSTHKKDKPWDTEDIDKWKIEPFKPEDNVAGPMTEESRFSTLFPKYREAYLKGSWKFITQALAKHGIGCELDLTEGSMTVWTTLKTYDPAAILNGEKPLTSLCLGLYLIWCCSPRSYQASCAIRTRPTGCQDSGR